MATTSEPRSTGCLERPSWSGSRGGSFREMVLFGYFVRPFGTLPLSVEETPTPAGPNRNESPAVRRGPIRSGVTRSPNSAAFVASLSDVGPP